MVVRDSRAYVLRRESPTVVRRADARQAAALKTLAEGFPLEQVKHTFQLEVPNTTDLELQRVGRTLLRFPLTWPGHRRSESISRLHDRARHLIPARAYENFPALEFSIGT